jgi:cytochrome c biogenesis protein CcdA
MVTLAIAVNTLELLCSAGLPAIYTKVLSMSSLEPAQYYSYLLLYVFMFMLDDLAVFAVAMVSFQAVGIESKYSRYAQLIGGILMVVLGIIMFTNPGLLTFAN